MQNYELENFDSGAALQAWWVDSWGYNNCLIHSHCAASDTVTYGPMKVQQ